MLFIGHSRVLPKHEPTHVDDQQDHDDQKDGNGSLGRLDELCASFLDRFGTILQPRCLLVLLQNKLKLFLLHPQSLRLRLPLKLDALIVTYFFQQPR
jgi:hypothetical protein